MSDFKSALQATVLGIQDAFSRADQDLHEEVAKAAFGIQDLTGGRALLQLSPVEEDSEGIDYYLVVTESDGSTNKIAFLSVPVKGYPIVVRDGSYRRGADLSDFPPDVLLQDRSRVSEWLTEMAGNPDSPLVKRVAFILRKK